METYDPYVACLAMMDERREAWNTSRPDFKEGDLPFEEVERMDLSLNSMRVYTFEIRSSVLFRDLIFSLRPIQGWAQSTRSAPLNRETLRLSSEFAHNEEDDAKIDEMIARFEAGEPRDKVRGLLTLSVSTIYTITLDHRVLMGFLKSLLELNPILFEMYGQMFLAAIDGYDAFNTSTVQPIHPFVQITPEESRAERTEQVGSMIFGYYNMKCAMAAQFLRQHYSKVKIGYWDMVPNYFSCDMSQSDQIPVAYYVDKMSYHRLMSMRAHWALDWSMDMWGGLISDYINGMTTEQFWDFLPNGNGKRDPYWADVYNRVLRKDPGIPCPIMCEWPAMIDEKEKEVGDSLVIRKYRDLATQGLIKDNPDNEHRKLYLSLGE
ncbi:MAG: hypothetical protein DRI46_09780 [Chloroflexi bacterium]|nr:MAG: hypothetical protein DRI46_09780 [Chloroflexota bacterium]